MFFCLIINFNSVRSNEHIDDYFIKIDFKNNFLKIIKTLFYLLSKIAYNKNNDIIDMTFVRLNIDSLFIRILLFGIHIV